MRDFSFLTNNTLLSEKQIVENWIHKSPKVTILCTSFNHENFIKDALNSFLNQRTNFGFKIFVGDDYSEDKSRQIIDEYVKLYPNLIIPIYSKLQKFKDFHIACTLFDLADTDYVALCDGDDSWSDFSKLQKQFNFLEENLDYVASHHSYVNVKNGLIESLHYALTENNDENLYNFSRDQLLKYVDILPSTLFFRNIPLEFPHYYKHIYNGDNFIISNLGIFGNCKFIKEISPTYRNIHNKSLWSSLSDVDKNLNLAQSRFWISIYWKSKNNLKLSNYYIKSSIQFILNIFLQILPRLAKNTSKSKIFRFTVIVKTLLKVLNVFVRNISVITILKLQNKIK